MPDTPTDKTALYEWLDQTIGNLPATGQIILNFDGNTVKWEVKSNHIGHDRNGDVERTEVRRFGQLVIRRCKSTNTYSVTGDSRADNFRT